MCMFCRLLFVLLDFFFLPLCCLFFDIRILIAPLVSSNSSYVSMPVLFFVLYCQWGYSMVYLDVSEMRLATVVN
jgi:hypothetical protein